MASCLGLRVGYPREPEGTRTQRAISTLRRDGMRFDPPATLQDPDMMCEVSILAPTDLVDEHELAKRNPVPTI
jgi:hypothetical protein